MRQTTIRKYINYKTRSRALAMVKSTARLLLARRDDVGQVVSKTWRSTISRAEGTAPCEAYRIGLSE